MSYPYWQEISSYLNKIDEEINALQNISPTRDIIAAKREKITHFLEHLKIGLEKRLDNIHASLILFAIVALIDEEVMNLHFIDQTIEWNPLQKDFYGAYNAGELFFKSVDESLDDASIPQIVYEVYYFVLKKGFKGKYRDSKTQITKYLEMLGSKIPSPKASGPLQNETIANAEAKNAKMQKWHYYATSASVLLIMYAFLQYSAHQL